ncbi:MAG: tail fiber protein [Victivallaceae bacterium]|nr:tail fiber protein [Victivallaceae bacterium]
MADPFLGQISIVGFKYAPQGWAFCNGQQMPMAQHITLYALIGKTFGGDGKTYFNLPDMRGKVPIGTGGGYKIGDTGGSEEVRLNKADLPAHTHKFFGINAPGTKNGPGLNKDNMLANNQKCNFFDFASETTVLLQPDSCGNTGGGDLHNNIQPSMGLNFIIAITGRYPTYR